MGGFGGRRSGEFMARKPTEGSCQKCNDTGVIETGNNDLPCSCPEGDKALFNVAGVDQAITGAELRRRLNST